MKTYIQSGIAAVLIASFVALLVPLQFAEAAVSNWQKGASVLPKNQTDFSSESFKQSMRNLQATGANYVSLIVPYYQSNPGATDIHAGWNTPTDAALTSAINYIHSLGMKVMLKPHLESYDNTWRAYIDPVDRNTWYAKYGGMLNHLADISKQTGVEAICLGTELISMAGNNVHSDNGDRWRTMIAGVRARYSGLLTYSSQWGPEGFTDEKNNIGFWNSLDAIGISAYFNLQTPSTNPEDIKKEWAKYEPQIKAVSDRHGGKQVIFTEVGYRSVNWAHQWPWNWSYQGSYDPVEQTNSYEALFSFWNNYSYMTGVHLWHWESDPNAGGEGNTDYTPQRKPAEAKLKSWYSQGGSTGGNTGGNTGGSTQTGTFTSSAVVTPTSPTQNQSTSIQATVAAQGSGSGLLVDLEVYNSAGTKVHQQFFENQTFTQNQSKTFTTNWTPAAIGQYIVKTGVFNSTWTTNYHWNNNAKTFTVVAATQNPPTNPPATTTPPNNPPTNPPTGAAVTNIWWPSNGASVLGVQPFKAMLEGRNITDYKMYWQVDGDRLNEMGNSNEDYPHKESWVDVSGWNWKGAGPYTINFVSKDNSGTTISQKSVDIYVR